MVPTRRRFVRIGPAIVAAIVLTVGMTVTVSGDPAPATYYACLKYGTLSKVGTARPNSCRSGSTVIQWSELGPQGPEGPQGPQGPQGPDGQQGPEGPGQISRAGIVNGDGTVQFAPDATITVTSAARYQIDFAAGTFVPGSVPIAVFEPIGDVYLTSTSTDYVGATGSGSVIVSFSGVPTAFHYLVTGQEP